MSKNIAAMYILAGGMKLQILFKCTVRFVAHFGFFSTNVGKSTRIP